VGFVYGVLALIYDLTLGDGIGPRLKWYPVVLLAIVVVFALLYFISTLVEESAPPSSPRPRSTQRALEPLSFEPSVLGQMSTRRWQRVHRRVKRRKRLRAVSLLLRLPLAVVIGLLAVLGEATNLDQFLPMDPWIRIPIFGLFALGILGVAVWVVLVAGGDLMSPAVFVVGRVLARKPLRGRPGMISSVLFVVGLKTDAVTVRVRNSFTVTAAGVPQASAEFAGGSMNVDCQASLLKRLEPGDAVVLVVVPDGRAVARLVDF
jgi:hypothetical protein